MLIKFFIGIPDANNGISIPIKLENKIFISN